MSQLLAEEQSVFLVGAGQDRLVQVMAVIPVLVHSGCSWERLQMVGDYMGTFRGALEVVEEQESLVSQAMESTYSEQKMMVDAVPEVVLYQEEGEKRFERQLLVEAQLEVLLAVVE
jgi:hypothetical protein